MISIISGTNRAENNSLHIAQFLHKCYSEANIESQILDLQDLPSELFTSEAYGEKPTEFVKNFSDPVLKSDGLHLVVGEYNGSFPGILKYFIDMLPFPEAFEAKPTAFTGLSAGDHGAIRAIEQLQMIFSYRNAYTFPKRVFLPRIFQVLDKNGALIDNELITRLRKQTKEFNSFITTIRTH
jgi:NAD(P)H-dependent FMN reductase